MPVATATNINDVEDYIRCIGKGILRNGAGTILQRFPAHAVDALRASSASGSFPTVGGQIGVQIADLREKLVSVSSIAGSVAFEMNSLADDMDRLKTRLAQSDLQADVAKRQDEIQKSNSESACMAALASAASSFLSAVGSLNVGGALSGAGDVGLAVAQCNTLSSIQSENDAIAGDQETLAKLDGELGLDDFRTQVRSHAQTLAGLNVQLSGAVEDVDAALAEIDRLRQKARRVVSRALFMASNEAAGQEQISAAMRQRRDAAKLRYERARKNAVHLTFVAKRAIEQRLGLHLSELRDPLPLVDAPASWEATLCSSSGLDYTALNNQAAANGTTNLIDGSNADTFVGEYVTKLENVVESYRMKNGFHEGIDTAVISLRDDIQNVRADCPVETGNLLTWSGDFAPRSQAGNSPGWYLDDCTLDSQGRLKDNCIAASAMDEAPFTPTFPELGGARGFTLRFGTQGGGGGDCGAGSTTCGFRSRAAVGDSQTTALAQTVQLGAGTYLLSWYEKATSSGSIAIRHADGTQDPIATAQGPSQPGAGWNRFFITIPLGAADTITIRVLQRPDSLETRTLAAVMLENISDVPSTKAASPRQYVSTTDSTTKMLPACEDTNGDAFRANWTRGCERLCASGFSTDCGSTNGTTQCYWETPFSVSQWAIERGQMLSASGFARGNFNYRIESVGVNFVGSGTRNCAGSDNPSTCYSAAFFPYSLRHEGPYVVRNFAGGDFTVNLFTANIEHARGLAAERYLTNPLSDSDESLIQQYIRTEFQGRPIDGNFTLRVWDEPGVQFDAIQDVQIVLKYRYWTRFN